MSADLSPDRIEAVIERWLLFRSPMIEDITADSPERAYERAYCELHHAGIPLSGFIASLRKRGLTPKREGRAMRYTLRLEN